MGASYSFKNHRNLVFDINALDINLSRLKYMISDDSLLIYLNAQFSSNENTFIIFSFNFPISEDYEDRQLLIPIFEMPQSTVSFIEPSISHYNDAVLLYCDNDLLLIKSDPVTNQMKQQALITNLDTLYKKFLFTSTDEKVICAGYNGAIDIFDINHNKFAQLEKVQDRTLTDICNIDKEMFKNSACVSYDNGNVVFFDYYNQRKIGDIIKQNLYRKNNEIYDNIAFNEKKNLLSMNAKNTCLSILYDVRKYDVELSRINFGKRGNIVYQKWNNNSESCLETMFLRRDGIQIDKVNELGKVDSTEKISNEEINDDIYQYESNGPYALMTYERLFEIYNFNEHIFLSS